MKKLMIAAAIVCAAVVVQAASVVNWNTGTVYAPGADGTGYAPEYGLVEPGTAGILATLFVGTGVDEAGNITGLVDLTGNTGTTVNGDYQMLGVTSAGLNDGATYYAQMIITYGDSTLASQVVTFETSDVTFDANPVFGDGGMGIMPIGANTFDEVYGAFSPAGWQTVPEPTSGLLLLLGVAGLALRRRHA